MGLRTQVSNLRDDVFDAQTTHDEDLQRIGELEVRVSSAETGAGEIGARVGALESHADPAAVAAAVQPSVFTIEAGRSLGSAFVVAGDGVTSTLATNYHVVEDAYENGDRTVAVLQEGASFTGHIDRVAPGDDLALVTVQAALPVLLQSHDVPRPGAPVLVIGSPLGLGGSVSSGAVSALRPFEGVTYIQFSAPISPGNSGGPLVNEQSQVIGITVAKVLDFGADGIGFAIPVAALCTTFQVCT